MPASFGRVVYPRQDTIRHVFYQKQPPSPPSPVAACFCVLLVFFYLSTAADVAVPWHVVIGLVTGPVAVLVYQHAAAARNKTRRYIHAKKKAKREQNACLQGSAKGLKAGVSTQISCFVN